MNKKEIDRTWSTKSELTFIKGLGTWTDKKQSRLGLLKKYQNTIHLRSKWGNIDGVKPRIIDNSELLEKIRRSTPHWRNIGIKRDRPSPLSRSRRYYEADEYQNRDDYVYGYFDSNDAWISIHE